MKETGKTKHYGVHNVSHKRLILLCLENPTKKGYTMGVEYDLLDAESRSQLINLIDGPEAQSVKDSYHVLAKNFFTEHPAMTMLKYLQSGGFVKEYNINDITLFIEPDRQIALSEVIKQVNAYESWKFGKSNNSVSENVEFETSVVEEPKIETQSVVQEIHPAPQPDTNALLADVLSKLTNKLSEMSDKLDALTNKSDPKVETKKPAVKKKK